MVSPVLFGAVRPGTVCFYKNKPKSVEQIWLYLESGDVKIYSDVPGIYTQHGTLVQPLLVLRIDATTGLLQYVRSDTKTAKPKDTQPSENGKMAESSPDKNEKYKRTVFAEDLKELKDAEALKRLIEAIPFPRNKTYIRRQLEAARQKTIAHLSFTAKQAS